MTSKINPISKNLDSTSFAPENEPRFENAPAFFRDPRTKQSISLAAELTGIQAKKYNRSCIFVCGPIGAASGIIVQIGFQMASLEILKSPPQPVTGYIAYGVGAVLGYVVAHQLIAWRIYAKDRVALHAHSLAIENYIKPESIICEAVFGGRPVPENVRKAMHAIEAYNKKVLGCPVP